MFYFGLDVNKFKSENDLLGSSHNSYFVLLGSVHIPAVLCYVLVSTCSSILNVYVASCFFIKMYIYIEFVFMIVFASCMYQAKI
jgi:hypothetical protein